MSVEYRMFQSRTITVSLLYSNCISNIRTNHSGSKISRKSSRGSACNQSMRSLPITIVYSVTCVTGFNGCTTLASYWKKKTFHLCPGTASYCKTQMNYLWIMPNNTKKEVEQRPLLETPLLYQRIQREPQQRDTAVETMYAL